jgi:tuftelin-interacting protein 11
MARRKRGFMDDGISDSSGGSDDEFADDDNPYQPKKRRRSDDDSEDEGFGGRSKPTMRRDWAKAPAFVSSKTTGNKPDLDQSEVMDIPDVAVGRDSGSESSTDSTEDEGDEEMDADDADDDGEQNSDEDKEDAEPPEAPPPRVRDEIDDEDEQRPRFGGLGLGASTSHPPTTFSGFSRSGIGASRPAAVSIPATPSPAPSPSPALTSDNVTIPSSLPSAFGGNSRPQRAFVRNATPTVPPPSKPSLSATESAHFRKLETSYGARMLAKMGWESGTGLGTEGRGIVVPIESKLRPKNMGIAFRGFGERTEQSRAEARRRGEVVSDDEDEERIKKVTKAKEKTEKKSDAWKKPKKVKTKIEHKTYEQIVAEVGEDVAGPSGLGVIIDATGATVSIPLSADN